MALTSENVVNHGAQVVEQITKISDKMRVFQQRINQLDTGLNDTSHKVEKFSDDLQGAINNLETSIKVSWMKDISDQGGTLTDTVKGETIESLEVLTKSFDNNLKTLIDVSNRGREDWENWQEKHIPTLMSSLDETEVATSNIIEETGLKDDDTFIIDTSDLYESKMALHKETLSSHKDLLIKMIENSSDLYLINTKDIKEKCQSYIDLYTDGLLENLHTITEPNIEESSEKFLNVVNNELIPIVTAIIQTATMNFSAASETVSSMGKKTDEKCSCLNQQAEVIDSQVQPVDESINYIKNIHDTVSAFLR